MAVQTFIDGVEVTNVVQEGSSTHRLNKVGTATCKIPIDQAVDGIGLRMKVIVDGNLDHHGTIKHVSDDDGEDGDGTTEYTSHDPRELWEWRPSRDTDGDFSDPSFLADFGSGPQIMEEILHNSEDAGAGPPTDAEGPLFIEFGTFEGGGSDLSGAPTDWPMTIEEIASLLCETGELDIVLTPIDSGGNMAQIDCYNGDYGTDLTASVVFEYATGAKNVRRLRRTQDIGKLVNKLFYFLGPRLDQQHWRRNVQGDDPGLPDPPQTAIAALIAQSRLDFGVRMDIRIYDSFGLESSVVPLFWRLWQNESILRAQFRTLAHATPIRGLPLTFDIGDLITLSAGAAFRGGFSGVQRVYERQAKWDVDGVIELSEIVTSADQETV